MSLSPPAKLALLHYDWPGNVRELRRTVENAQAWAEMRKAKTVRPDHLRELDSHVVKSVRAMPEDEVDRALWKFADQLGSAEGLELGGGRQRRVAKILGVSESTASRLYTRFLSDDAT